MIIITVSIWKLSIISSLLNLLNHSCYFLGILTVNPMTVPTQEDFHITTQAANPIIYVHGVAVLW